MTSFGISFAEGAQPVSTSGTSVLLQSTSWLSALPWEEPTEPPEWQNSYSATFPVEKSVGVTARRHFIFGVKSPQETGLPFQAPCATQNLRERSTFSLPYTPNLYHQPGGDKFSLSA